MDLQKEVLKNASGIDNPNQQAVIIHLQFRSGKFQKSSVLNALIDLDDIFAKVVETSEVGVYDGNEFYEGPDEESVSFFFYGPDANLIYHEIKPILDSLPELPGSRFIKRYSSFDNGGERVVL